MSRPAVATGLGSEAIRDVDGAAAASSNVTFARRIIRTLRGNYALYGAAITAMVIYTGTSLVPPLLLRQVLLGLETGRHPGVALSTALLLLALLFLARGVFRFLFIYLPHLVAYRLLCTIRVELFGHLQTRSQRFLTRQQTGQLMSRAVNDVEAIELFVAHAFPQIVISLAVPVVIVALMAAISWEVTLVALAFLPFSLAALFFFGPRVKAKFKPLRATLAALNAGMQDAMGGVFVTKSFHREAAQLAKLRDQAAAYRNAIFRLLPVGVLPLSVAETIANLALVAVAGYGATLAAAGQLRVADLVALLLFTVAFYAPLVSTPA